MSEGDQLNELSEILLGYQEGTFDDMRKKAYELKEYEYLKAIYDGKDSLLTAVDTLRSEILGFEIY